MQNFLAVVFFFASIGDGFTTVFGTFSLLERSEQALAVALIVSIVVYGFLVGTSWIFHRVGEGFIFVLMLPFWAIALGYDMYTSFKGTIHFLFGGRYTDEQLVLVLIITALISSSPILFSLLIDRDRR